MLFGRPAIAKNEFVQASSHLVPATAGDLRIEQIRMCGFAAEVTVNPLNLIEVRSINDTLTEVPHGERSEVLQERTPRQRLPVPFH
jgi:hypothetical protein